MASLRSLPDGCASSTSLLLSNAADTMIDVQAFLAKLGSVDVEDLALCCSVNHPDGLQCTCQAEVFKLPGGVYLLEMTRLRGDSVLFSLVSRLMRTFLATGIMPELFLGQLLPRRRVGPTNDPATVPELVLPPASGMLWLCEVLK